MKVAIISDIHENFHNLILTLIELEKLKIERILLLGDLMNNGIAKILAASLIPVFGIWGNNDGDKIAITKTSLRPGSNLEMGFGTYDFLEIDGRKLFLTHYPLLAKSMAKSGDFDAIFYGHDHKKNIDTFGKCLILNPGEISGHKTGEATFAVYDTSTNEAEIKIINNSMSLKTKTVDNYLEKNKLTLGEGKTRIY